MANYVFDEVRDGNWRMYRSQGTWDRYDDPLKYDRRKSMAEELDAYIELQLLTNDFKEVGFFQEPLDDLMLNIISTAKNVFVKFYGESEYKGYREFLFAPYFDDLGNWIHHSSENSWVKIYKPLIDDFEWMVGQNNPDSQIVENVVYDRVFHFLNKFMREYSILVPIKTNQDAKAFENMKENWWEENKDYIIKKSFLTDEVINHKTTNPSVKLNSIQKRFEFLKKQHTPQAYNVKEVFFSACNFYAKLIDIHCEYLFWRVFYTPQEIPINNDEYGPYTYFEELRNRIPSFSPLAGFNLNTKVKKNPWGGSVYGVVNASYLGYGGFVSPFSRGYVETLSNALWESFNNDLKATNVLRPHYLRNLEAQYIKLKQNKLWD